MMKHATRISRSKHIALGTWHIRFDLEMLTTHRVKEKECEFDTKRHAVRDIYRSWSVESPQEVIINILLFNAYLITYWI